MQKEVCCSHAAFAGVLLPDFAHHKLKQARDQLVLLSQLAGSRGEDHEVEFRIMPDALAELFDRQAQYLDEVLDCVRDAPPYAPKRPSQGTAGRVRARWFGLATRRAGQHAPAFGLRSPKPGQNTPHAELEARRIEPNAPRTEPGAQSRRAKRSVHRARSPDRRAERSARRARSPEGRPTTSVHRARSPDRRAKHSTCRARSPAPRAESSAPSVPRTRRADKEKRARPHGLTRQMLTSIRPGRRASDQTGAGSPASASAARVLRPNRTDSDLRAAFNA